ncbi:NTE family protein [Amycolatopsis pretoriensis]|uniref:NTE family protein n=1 Tax=Amycolatopsis pretoriensis TaxID=218821 RepID=A0A1H5R1S1_9PSEU|nr:patatin-like phospholipase family protein [Amycolatopsis pretoriensis]SEF32340.1 NTE family protein [Amycolatopsis pretoriensis]
MDTTVSPIALVLGGGGPAGVAWTSALLHGLISHGLPVAESDEVLGTSAGSVVGAWLTMRPDDLPALPQRMLDRARWHAHNAESGYGDRDLLRRVVAGSTRDTESARNIAQAAIAAIPPISAERAETLWRATLPEGPWPDRLKVTSVNAGTGAAKAWSAADGVSLAAAVACSTAAPGAAPPVTLASSVWVDGAVRSGTNADLVRGIGSATRGRVLVLAPLPNDHLSREEITLVESGHRVTVITAEPFYETIADLMNPRFVDIAAAAGAKQARAVAADLGRWWSD